MSENDFQQSVRYVQAMERECAKRPDLNACLLSVYRDLLAAAARGPDAYLEAAWRRPSRSPRATGIF